jgi:hypothetical protein
MLKVFTDFNASTSDGACFILTYEGADLERQLEIKNGFIWRREIKLYWE